MLPAFVTVPVPPVRYTPYATPAMVPWDVLLTSPPASSSTPAPVPCTVPELVTVQAVPASPSSPVPAAEMVPPAVMVTGFWVAASLSVTVEK